MPTHELVPVLQAEEPGRHRTAGSGRRGRLLLPNSDAISSRFPTRPPNVSSPGPHGMGPVHSQAGGLEQPNRGMYMLTISGESSSLFRTEQYLRQGDVQGAYSRTGWRMARSQISLTPERCRNEQRSLGRDHRQTRRQGGELPTGGAFPQPIHRMSPEAFGEFVLYLLRLTG